VPFQLPLFCSSLLLRISRDGCYRNGPGHPEADARLSREASWHPVHIASRVLHAALRNAARWLSSTAVAFSGGGDDAKHAVLAHAEHTVRRTRDTTCPPRS